MPQRKRRGQKRQTKSRSSKKTDYSLQKPISRSNYALNSYPQYIDVKLVYNAAKGVNIGTSAGDWILTPNSFKPDPAISTCAGGFVKWAAMYDLYRITKFKVKAQCVNMDTQPAMVVLTTSNENNIGQGYGDNMAIQRSKSAVLGPSTGSCKAILSISRNVGELTGDAGVETADSYRAVINTSPGNTVWADVSCYASNGTATNGVWVVVEVTQYVRFFTSDLPSQDAAPTLEFWHLKESGSTDQDILDYFVQRRKKRKEMKQLAMSQRLMDAQ